MGSDPATRGGSTFGPVLFQCLNRHSMGSDFFRNSAYLGGLLFQCLNRHSMGSDESVDRRPITRSPSFNASIGTAWVQTN